MKSNQFLVLIAAVLLFWPTSELVPVKDNIYDLMAAEGMVAMQISTVKVEKPKEPEVKACKCDGKGYELSPDGITKIPCQCGKDCTCSRGTAKVCPKCGRSDCPSLVNGAPHETVPAPTPFVNKGLSEQMLFLTAAWCGPCQTVHKTVLPVLKKNGWNVSKESNATLREIDIDAHPEVYVEYGKGRPIPIFIKLKKGVETNSIVGVTTAEKVSHMWYK